MVCGVGSCLASWEHPEELLQTIEAHQGVECILEAIGLLLDRGRCDHLDISDGHELGETSSTLEPALPSGLNTVTTVLMLVIEPDPHGLALFAELDLWWTHVENFALAKSAIASHLATIADVARSASPTPCP